jgi:hypothetical protein
VSDGAPNDIKPVTSFPFYVTPEQFAEHFGWSAREVRRKAREIGACRIMGNAMILIQADIDALMEATRPAPKLLPNPPAFVMVTIMKPCSS